MIKALGRHGDGRPLLLLGLSGENMTRLMAGEPITLAMAGVHILLVGGRDETAISEDLKKHGLLQ